METAWEKNNPIRWFYFALHRIYPGGAMDIHVDDNIPQEFPFGEKEPDVLRELHESFYDGPGPSNALWWGYVRARTPEAAEYRVRIHY